MDTLIFSFKANVHKTCHRHVSLQATGTTSPPPSVRIAPSSPSPQTGPVLGFVCDGSAGWRSVSGHRSRRFDSAPSWSPDAQWLVFETYTNDNLEIAVVSVNDRAQPIISSNRRPRVRPFACLGCLMAGMWHLSPLAAATAMCGSIFNLTGNERYQNLSNTPVCV